MNDFLRPSLYSAYQEILPTSQTTTEPLLFDIVGPVCETGDFLGRDRLLAIKNKIYWRLERQVPTALL